MAADEDPVTQVAEHVQVAARHGLGVTTVALVASAHEPADQDDGEGERQRRESDTSRFGGEPQKSIARLDRRLEGRPSLPGLERAGAARLLSTIERSSQG